MLTRYAIGEAVLVSSAVCIRQLSLFRCLKLLNCHRRDPLNRCLYIALQSGNRFNGVGVTQLGQSECGCLPNFGLAIFETGDQGLIRLLTVEPSEIGGGFNSDFWRVVVERFG